MEPGFPWWLYYFLEIRWVVVMKFAEIITFDDILGF